MNLPFDFTYAATNDYGILWNVYGLTTGATEVLNATLTALPSGANVMLPLGDVYLEAISIMTDATGAAPVTVGYWDTATSLFVGLYTILATAVAGGGIGDCNLGDGFLIPNGRGTIIPAIRMDGAGAGRVTGHVKLYVVSGATLTASQTGGGTGTIVLLDDNNQPILDSLSANLTDS